MNNYNNYQPSGNNYQPSGNYWNGGMNQQPYDVQSLDARVSAVMKLVYVKMFLALLVSAATAAGVCILAPGIQEAVMTNGWIYWGLAIVEIGLVLWISARLTRMSPALSTGLFFLFAVVNGLTLSVIFVAYTPVSILKTFLITAGVFGAMSIYGYFTTRDLTKIGSFLYMALFGLIICCVVNIFWNNGPFGWIISGLGVLIFIGLTAWDTQQIKKMAAMNPASSTGTLATWGALSLYLDFINLFLYLLRFFGNRN